MTDDPTAPIAPVPRRTYAFQVQAWKRAFLRRYFPDRDFVFVPFFLGENRLRRDWLERIDLAGRPEFLAWSLNLPPVAEAFARRHGIPVAFLEDGFIRSAVPHAGRTPPLSLTLDSRTAYFDSRTASDLEVLLSTYDFAGDPDVVGEARRAIDLLLSTGISKYNGGSQTTTPAYPPKTRRRVLVIGQVDGDASIRYGSQTPVRNDDLVRLAVSENPDAEVIYRPHPDVLGGVRTSKADLAALGRICTIMTTRMPMARAFETIDHVYTITSLAGFEALLRGIPVTALGLPFYAGWGLTDDRHINARRRRALTIEQLFAGAYLLYPLYFRPETGERVTFQEVIRDLAAPVGLAFRDGEPRRRTMSGPYGLFGWRHGLSPVVARLVRMAGTPEDADYYRHFPIDFFRERPESALRAIGRLLYPFDEAPR